jgi:hypothetical protein
MFDIAELASNAASDEDDVDFVSGEDTVDRALAVGVDDNIFAASSENPPKLDNAESPPKLDNAESPPNLDNSESPPNLDSVENPPKLDNITTTLLQKPAGDQLLDNYDIRNNEESLVPVAAGTNKQSNNAMTATAAEAVDTVINNNHNIAGGEQNGDKAAVAFSLGVYQPRKGRLKQQLVVPRVVSGADATTGGNSSSSKGPRALRRQHGKRYDKVRTRTTVSTGDHRHLTSRPFRQYRTVLLAVLFLHGVPSHSSPETPVGRNRHYSDLSRRGVREREGGECGIFKLATLALIVWDSRSVYNPPSLAPGR